MATITRRPFVNHLRADATTFVQHRTGGTVRHEGRAAAFWYVARTATITQVPLDDREQALLFHARTADFQDVTVQASIDYRIVDPALSATRIDFGIDPRTGNWTSTPLDRLGALLTELAQEPALEQLAGMSMADALARGIPPVHERVAGALAGDARLVERGIAVTDVRIVAIRADAELERALQTETRERVQQEADRATFERRALAVERERAIAENELRNKIELAKREAELVEQNGRNARARATEKAAADGIETEALAAGRRKLAETDAAGIRAKGLAEAEVETAKLTAQGAVDPATLMAIALRELAEGLPSIEHLTITPDLVAPLLQRFAAAPGTGAGAGAVGAAR